MDDRLAVVICFFNPCGYKRIARNLITTTNSLLETCSEVYVAELTYTINRVNKKSIKNELDHRVKVLPFKARSVIWHKEQLLNKAALQLADMGYKHIAVLDGDIIYPEPDWSQCLVEMSEQYKLVQGFQSAYLEGRQMAIRESELKAYFRTRNMFYGVPGGAWVARAEFWKKIGLFEWNIIGGGDSAFVAALLKPIIDRENWNKRVKQSGTWANVGIGYMDKLDEYGKKLHAYVGEKFAFAPINAVFQSHGDYSKRNYTDRHLLIEGIEYDKELEYNKYGLFEWIDRKNERLEKVENYFTSRCEDE